MSIVNDAIENSVGQGGIRDAQMPIGNRDLAGDDGEE